MGDLTGKPCKSTEMSNLLPKSLLILLPLITAQEASYSILTTWNGDEVRHDPASVTLGSTDTGDLTIHIEASLVGDLEFLPNCNPNRPYPGLWNYEVVEAFFLDPVSISYVELEFHPCGAHLALLLHPGRKMGGESHNSIGLPARQRVRLQHVCHPQSHS